MQGNSEIPTFQFGDPIEDIIGAMRHSGVVIVDNVFSPEDVIAINAELEPHVSNHHAGAKSDNPLAQAFHGNKTKRVSNVFVLSPTFRAKYMENPEITAYCKAFFGPMVETILLSMDSVIETQPGQGLQMLHRDMGCYPFFMQYGPSGPDLVVNMLIAMTDITEERGATRVIPGSHKWAFDVPYDQSMTVPAILKAGSMAIIDGKTVHGGGHNATNDVRRRVISTQFSPSFMMPEEAYPFTVPREVVREMSPQLRQMTCFASIHQTAPLGASLWLHNLEDISSVVEF